MVRLSVLLFPVQLVNQIFSSYPSQFIDDISPFFGFVPEEELTLRQFLALGLGTEYGFQCIGWKPVYHASVATVMGVGVKSCTCSR